MLESSNKNKNMVGKGTILIQREETVLNLLYYQAPIPLKHIPGLGFGRNGGRTAF